MADKDMFNNQKAEVALDQQVVSAAGTVQGNIIDTLGFCAATFHLQLQAVAGGNHTLRVVEGDDPALADGVDAERECLLFKLGAGPTQDLTPDPIFTAAEAGSVLRLGYVGNKRYLRLEIDSDADGFTGNANAVLEMPTQAPVANPQVAYCLDCNLETSPL